MGTNGHRRGLVSPVDLPPYADPDDDGSDTDASINVVIETARGGRNKMAYDVDLGIFRLKKVLPEGMSFPADFGFVPSTMAEDGDPLDALVLMDEPGVSGCLVGCRLIGALLGTQQKHGKVERNDRLVAVALPSHTHGDIRHFRDLNHDLLGELEKFFVTYHEIYGEKYRVVDRKGPRTARRLVDEAAKAWKKLRREGRNR